MRIQSSSLQCNPQTYETPDSPCWGIAAAAGTGLGISASSPRFSLAELVDAGKALTTATPWTEQRANALHTEGASHVNPAQFSACTPVSSHVIADVHLQSLTSSSVHIEGAPLPLR